MGKIKAEQFTAMLFLLVSQVVQLISEAQGVSEEEAIKKLYHSRLYELLEDEETKLWHYSPQLLYAMFDEETRTGEITFPEEAA